MDIRLQDCFVAVDDHDKAIAFYRNALGLEVRNDVSAYGMRWVTLGSPAQPEVNIVLEPPAADPGISQADREIMADLLAKGLLRGLNFSTPDLDAAFERIAATGAEVIQEPMDQSYGRDCAFRDPAGNMIRLIERPR
ncbi:MAG TPA: VOC family protein [candidate division Zixibacteria bacterium]|nr:VOC family protein [candidate division Zixibacteria bacterium]